MPVEVIEPAEGNVVTIKATGKLAREDYAVFVPIIEARIEDLGPVRLLFVMQDFHGWHLGAMWDDLKFGVHHFRDIQRIAMVGETKWQEHMITFCKPFVKAEIRYFDAHELETAQTWVNE